jgi:hypothetical protein
MFLVKVLNADQFHRALDFIKLYDVDHMMDPSIMQLVVKEKPGVGHNDFRLCEACMQMNFRQESGYICKACKRDNPEATVCGHITFTFPI